MFDEHKDSGLTLQLFAQLLKDYQIQRDDLTRQAIIKVFQTNSSNKTALSFEELVRALQELKEMLSRPTSAL